MIATDAHRDDGKRFIACADEKRTAYQGTKCAKLRKRSEWPSEREFGQAGRLDHVNVGTYVPRI